MPSAFEIGLSDCRWIYRLQDRTVTVRALASGDEPAMHWRVAVEGEPCRFLVFAHLVLGERELDHAGRIEIDPARKRIACRPDPASRWGRRYPDAVYFMVTDTPDAIEAVGGDELLHADGRSRGGCSHLAMRTGPTSELGFTVVASLTDRRAAQRLAARYERAVDEAAMAEPAAGYWAKITRGLRIAGSDPDLAALNTIFPWLAHNAIMHLTVAHGLEQYTGAAWGTRDVCQGPVEFLLALEHDEPVKDILRIVFAQQSHSSGDWPQWFMLDPYADIRDRHSHGDVIVWPLKALCDYLDATNDLAFLDERIAWRGKNGSTTRKNSVRAHVDRLLATVRKRFIPGTQLIRYGEGDWNDLLQPADPTMRDWMVSSWTVALLYQQINRYAEILSRVGDKVRANDLRDLAAGMRGDFNRLLIRGGTVAGYALFDPARKSPELLLHPTDTRTGLRYSLLPMTRAIIAGLFTKQQAQHHLRLIRQHLLFPDGARLIDKPVLYRGGPEQVFRRAEFGGVLRSRDRPHVRARPPSLRRSDGGLGRGRCALGGPAGGKSDHRHRAAGSRLTTPAQCLLQQQRRRLFRSLRGQRRMAAGQGRIDPGRRRLAHLFERSGPIHQSATLPRLRHPTALRAADCKVCGTALARAYQRGNEYRRRARAMETCGKAANPAAQWWESRRIAPRHKVRDDWCWPECLD